MDKVHAYGVAMAVQGRVLALGGHKALAQSQTSVLSLSCA